MKKIKIILPITIIIFIISFGLYKVFLERTPERIFKQNFDISLDDFDYTIEKFEEQWILFNGNGYVDIMIKFNKLTSKNIEYFKKFNFTPLYLLKHTHIGGPYKYSISDEGYYMYEVEDYSNKIFIIDFKNKKAIYKCNVM